MLLTTGFLLIFIVMLLLAVEYMLGPGGGLRILFNELTRSYLRMDYSFGFKSNAGGPGKLQHGFYFTFGEAF